MTLNGEDEIIRLLQAILAEVREMNSRQSGKALDELTALSQEMGLYEPGPNPLIKS